MGSECRDCSVSLDEAGEYAISFCKLHKQASALFSSVIDYFHRHRECRCGYYGCEDNRIRRQAETTIVAIDSRYLFV